jgi:MFS family permease
MILVGAMKSQYRIIGVCYVGWLFDFYDLTLIAYVLPLLIRDFNLTGSQASWLLGIGLGASGVGGIFFGWLADRWGRKSVLMITISLYSLGTALGAFAYSVESFLFFRALAGLGVGGEWAVGHALVAESVDKSVRGRAGALLQSGEPVGVALAAAVGLLLAPKVGWRPVFFCSGFLGLWSLVIRRYVTESQVWRNARERIDPALLRRSIRAQFGTRRGVTLLVNAYLLATFKLGTYWTCYVWMPKILLQEFHEPVGQTALWILTTQLGQFLGMQTFGIVSDRWGRRQAFTVFSVLTAAALYSLAFHWQAIAASKPIFWTVLFFLGIGSGCTAGFGVLLAELFPTEIRNLTMGTVYNLARGVQLFAPYVVMLAMARDGVRGALTVPLILALLTATWVWTLPETRSKDLAPSTTEDGEPALRSLLK